MHADSAFALHRSHFKAEQGYALTQEPFFECASSKERAERLCSIGRFLHGMRGNDEID